MRVGFSLLLAFTLFSAKDRITIDSSETLKLPAGVQGNFTVAKSPAIVNAYLFRGLPQSNEKALWSSWGNGCFASNGKYYTTIGDHLGYDGNSFVYEYDPGNGSLKTMVDVAQAIHQKPGDYGHGKIHAGIHEYQGGLYFATYHGKAQQIEEALKKGYRGSILFRFDLKSQKLENLGAIAPGQTFPVSALDSSRGLLYFNTVPKGDLLVYDLKKRSVRFQSGSSYISAYRCLMLTKEGAVYFSNDQGALSFYDPNKNTIATTKMSLPGEKNTLRTATAPASDGRIFGMTKAGRMFEFQPAKQTIKDLGPNFLAGDYTAVMTLSPDNKFVYFAPGSHGSGAKFGTPIIQHDVRSGIRKVIAFLRDPLIGRSNYFTGGNYNLVLDPKGAVLYTTFNGAAVQKGSKKQDDFGFPSLITITIPQSER